MILLSAHVAKEKITGYTRIGDVRKKRNEKIKTIFGVGILEQHIECLIIENGKHTGYTKM